MFLPRQKDTAIEPKIVQREGTLHRICGELISKMISLKIDLDKSAERDPRGLP